MAFEIVSGQRDLLETGIKIMDGWASVSGSYRIPGCEARDPRKSGHLRGLPKE